ncbi:MAG: ABC transporter ATP-binding protein [Syntrophobacteraceae bacterium]|nr:ABC transporter ATP-binding protein [Syntrophobacteraceae bacterium]
MSVLEAGSPLPRPLLRVESVSKSFGGIQALYQVSFEVAPGTIHSVIGPNGAGKTTLFNVVTGAYVPEGGRIVYQDKEIQGKRVHELVAWGIARTFQNVELFGSMTALENVLVGQHVRTRCGFMGAMGRWPWVRREEEEARRGAHELLRFVGLEKVAGQRSEDLPFGWQRFLEIARALGARPRLLLLDEPASGLNAVETQRLGELLRAIREKGVTLLLVEHDMSLAMGISDSILVLHQGRKLAEGTPREIQANEDVIAAYLGSEHEPVS